MQRKVSTRTFASQALATLRTILADDGGRAERLRSMADRIASKAKAEPRRIGCGETFEALRDLAKEVQS